MSEKALNQNENKATGERRYGSRRPMEPKEDTGEKTTVISLTRTSKVVKGGKRFSFRALVVVGDGAGKIGVSIGKANTVQQAIAKASLHAQKHMVTFPLINATIPHETIGKFGTGQVWMKPAAPGTGVIAGAGVRAVLEAGGVHNILTKNIGSSNSFNMTYATVNALMSLRSKEQVKAMRGGAQAEEAAPAAEEKSE